MARREMMRDLRGILNPTPGPGTWPMAERGHEDVKDLSEAEYRSLNGALRFRRANVLGRCDRFRLHRRGASACYEWC